VVLIAPSHNRFRLIGSVLASVMVIMLASVLAIMPQSADAQVEDTRDAILRFEETFASRLEDGLVDRNEMLPLLLVSARPYFERSAAAYGAAVVASLSQVVGASQIRVCDACVRPDVRTSTGRLETRTGPETQGELRALDESLRGQGERARAAVWIDETAQGGVSVRIVSLSDARVLYADVVTSTLEWSTRSRKNYSISQDALRRGRGDSLTHAFVDVGMYPSQHIALDWMEQWGATNENLTGISLSLLSPVLGLGPTYARAFPKLYGSLLGGKVMLSVPTSIAKSLSKGQSGDLIDPIVSAVGYMRVPIPLFSGNYGGFVFLQLPQGRFGVGLSANNMSLLPVIP